jgi:sterol desaturase/sphingolipid hydroxylase (fatty acid hydroxylase superfamily)
MNLCYMLGGLLFWFCDKFKLLHKYKIQIQKYPNTTDYIQCIWNLIQNYILIIFPLLYISYPIFTKLGFSTALPLPSFFTWSWQIFFFMLCEDISHYFLHRLLHTPYLYKKIHKIHHIYSSPFGLAASFAHPLEVLILGAATFSGPLIIIPHYFTFYSWVLYRQLDAVITHSGYNLPNLLDILPFYGGTTSHDFHHKSFIWNYSSRFTFMDKLFGTYKDPSNSEKLSLS